MNVCKRCGQCCFYEVAGVIKAPCRFLIFHNVGTRIISSCRIYHQRLGTIVYKQGNKGFICIERKNDIRRFDGCPLNSKFVGKDNVYKVSKI